MYRPRDYHAKWSQGKERQTIWCHLYVEPKIWHKWTHLQSGNGLTDTGNRPTAGERGVREEGLEVWG